MSAPKSGWRTGRDSYSVARVYFKDGNARSFYSYDWKHSYSRERNRELGLHGLRERIVKKFATQTDVIDIYDLGTNKLVERYYEGNRVG